MKLSKIAAQGLANEVLNGLCNWSLLEAALQVGGWEVKTADIVVSAFNRWGSVYRSGYFPMREYRQVDIAFIDAKSIGKPYLHVGTFFEIKFNFAKQVQSGKNGAYLRLEEALKQVKRYRSILRPGDAQFSDYILFIVVNPMRSKNSMPQHQKKIDTGWGYSDTGQNYYNGMSQKVCDACRKLGLKMLATADRFKPVKPVVLSVKLWVFVIEPQCTVESDEALDEPLTAGGRAGRQKS